MQKLSQQIEEATGIQKFQRDNAKYDYPRQGPNNKIKEIDLRIWDTLFSESFKVLNKWDQYHDIAKALEMNVEIPNIEMMVEFAWNTKNWSKLRDYENILKKSDSLKHKMYLLYLCIKNQQVPMFDEAFKSIINMAQNKWDLQLPKYVDNVHFENLIMY